MTFRRDPLSEHYDAAAARLVGEAIRHPGRWVYRTVPRPPSYTAIGGWLAAHGLELSATDTGGLTVWQRSWQRSVYWVFEHQADQEGLWSLQRCWGGHIAAGRQFGARVSPYPVAVRAVDRMPAADRYTANRALASGGEGSGLERF